jgi:hypothetical protein
VTTTYRLHISELTDELQNSIKAAFKDKTVEIVVSDEINETKSAFGFWENNKEDLYQDYLKAKLG